MAQQKVKSAKVKKKHWYEMQAPALFNNQSLGKSLVTEPQDLMNKQVRMSVMNLIGDMKKQFLIISFSVASVADNIGKTQIEKFYMMPSSVKRLVRRNRDRVDHRFETETKDKVRIVIKPIIVTRNITSRAVRTALRKAVLEYALSQSKTSSFEALIKSIILGKFQSGAKSILKKITPLRLVEVRVVQRLH
jgi:ribosomal protein S3AE